MKIIITSILILLFSVNAHSAEITYSDSYYKDHRFFVSLDATVEGTPEQVFKVLTDYQNITKISPKIIESKILKKTKNTIIVRTVVRGCVLFFCREVINTQIVSPINKKSISSSTIAEESNLKFGKMEWYIEKVDSGTKIEYSAEIEPDFFVPPLIGTFFMKNAMLKEAEAFVAGLEKVIHENLEAEDLENENNL